MATKNIQVVKNGETTTVDNVIYNGTDCNKVYAKMSQDDTFILLFEKAGGIIKMKIAAGNWKMNPTTAAEAVNMINILKQSLGDVPDDSKCVVFPPMCFIESVVEAAKDTNIEVGAQHIASAESGAFTGQCSAAQVHSLGAKWVLVGHSEVKYYLYDNANRFNQEVMLALQHGMNVILCVGENLEQREAGTTDSVVRIQLASALKNISDSQMQNIVITYEPVWATGTGKTATTDQAEEMCRLIRNWIQERFGSTIANKATICYGGTIRADDSVEIAEQPDIDGGLFGAASLKPDFAQLAKNIFNS